MSRVNEALEAMDRAIVEWEEAAQFVLRHGELAAVIDMAPKLGDARSAMKRVEDGAKLRQEAGE